MRHVKMSRCNFVKLPAFQGVLALLGLSVICLSVWAAEPALLRVEVDIADQAALQRGARFFMNYCSGCHSLRYMRYNRMAKDLGLTTFDGRVDSDLLQNNLIFTEAEVHDPIQISMPQEEARQWFGQVPPDLSLVVRQRGAAWVYTFLKSFYADPSQPYGSNNSLYPDVAMPNVLAPLEGEVRWLPTRDAQSSQSFRRVTVRQGEMSEMAFNSALNDLVTFLTYVSEPIQQTRHTIGFFVMFLLGLFLIVTWQLKRLYWRNLK